MVAGVVQLAALDEILDGPVDLVKLVAKGVVVAGALYGRHGGAARGLGGCDGLCVVGRINSGSRVCPLMHLNLILESGVTVVTQMGWAGWTGGCGVASIREAARGVRGVLRMCFYSFSWSFFFSFFFVEKIYGIRRVWVGRCVREVVLHLAAAIYFMICIYFCLNYILYFYKLRGKNWEKNWRFQIGPNGDVSNTI